MYSFTQLIQRLPIIILIAIISSLLITLSFIAIRKFLSPKQNMNIWLFLIKTSVLISYLLTAFITLFPSWSTLSINGIDVIPINLVPFRSISNDIKDGNYIPVIGNILVLIPLPIVLSLIFKAFKTVVYIAIITTIMIEPVQLLINLITNFPNNVIDIDDFILNLTGCIIGILLISVFRSAVINIFRQKLV